MSLKNELVKQLATLLSSSESVLAIAESCTGGLVSAACTGRSGSSQWYAGGFVTYTNELKSQLLNVSEKTLQQYGAVSIEVAKEMCEGVANACNANVSISTTGIAGPTGGTEAKPIGTVCIGCFVDGESHASMFHFSGDREHVREQAVQASLEMCLGMLRGNTNDQ